MSDWYEQYKANFDKEMAKQRELPKGLVKGKILRISVADGYAYYQVVKVNKKTVRIKWRKELSCDEWQYYGWGEGGSFPIDLIKPLIEGEERLLELLSESGSIYDPCP